MLRAASFAVFALALTSCAAAPAPAPQIVTRLVRVPVAIPVNLQTCSDAPPVPTDITRQSDVAHYIGHLWLAWDDCHSKYAALVGAITQSNAGADGP
jgi:hypothetical protein